MKERSTTRVVRRRSVRRAGLPALCCALLACIAAACGGGGGGGHEVNNPDGSTASSSSRGAVSDASGASDSAPEAAPTGGSDASPAPEASVGSDGGFASCAQITVPLIASGSSAHFIIPLSTGVDLSGATITVDAYAPGARAGILQAYVQQGSAHSYNQFFLGWKALASASSWTTFSWSVPAMSTDIERLGLSVEPGAADAGGFEQPDTILYVGRITVTAPSASVGPYVFNRASTVGAPTPVYPPGELWLNPDDTPAPPAGSSVLWNATCGTPIGLDAGTVAEAGSPDATAADASTSDGGSPPDANAPSDGSAPNDAGDGATAAPDGGNVGSSDASDDGSGDGATASDAATSDAATSDADMSDAAASDGAVADDGTGTANLIVDGTFESGAGAWSDWGLTSLAVTSTTAHSGMNSLLGTGLNNGAIFRDIASLVAGGHKYQATAWVSVANVAGGSEQVKWQTVQNCDGASADSYPWLNGVTVGNGEWMQVTGVVDLTACTTINKLLLFAGAASGDLYIDDVTLTALP